MSYGGSYGSAGSAGSMGSSNPPINGNYNPPPTPQVFGGGGGGGGFVPPPVQTIQPIRNPFDLSGANVFGSGESQELLKRLRAARVAQLWNNRK